MNGASGRRARSRADDEVLISPVRAGRSAWQRAEGGALADSRDGGLELGGLREPLLQPAEFLTPQGPGAPHAPVLPLAEGERLRHAKRVSTGLLGERERGAKLTAQRRLRRFEAIDPLELLAIIEDGGAAFAR